MGSEDPHRIAAQVHNVQKFLAFTLSEETYSGLPNKRPFQINDQYLPEGLGYGDGSDGTVPVVRQPLDALHVDPIILHPDLGLGTSGAALPRRLSRRLNLVKGACLRIQYARDFSLLLLYRLQALFFTTYLQSNTLL